MRRQLSAHRPAWLTAATIAGLLLAQGCKARFEYDLHEEKPAGAESADSSWGATLGELLWPLIEEHDTKYAPDYSEEAFRSLELGAGQHTAEEALGAPLEVKEFPDGEIYWYYSRHGERSENYFVRILVFDEQRRLVGKRHSFYLD